MTTALSALSESQPNLTGPNAPADAMRNGVTPTI